MKGYKDRDLSICETYVMRVISALLIVALVNLVTIDSEWNKIEYVNHINNIGFIISIICTFIIVTCISVMAKKSRIHNIDAVIFMAVSVAFGFFILFVGRDIYFTVTVVFFVILAVRYILLRFPCTLKQFVPGKKMVFMFIIFVAVLTLIYVGSLVVLRYYLFRTPTFDFGIFSQMYYYMKETGMPMTTCERNYYLSHFAIHFSPVFYLILPVYMIFPSPVTLIVMQLLIVMSGAIPIYFICRNKKMSNLITGGLVTVFLLYPTMRSGLFYDFHENKFLPPLLLWLIYFLDNENMSVKKRRAGIIIFTLLSLMVKEDAAIYVACIGLFILAYKREKKEKLTGLIILAGAVLYFCIVFYCLNKFGHGSSINSIGRYDNLMVSSEDGLTGMVMNILKDPAYVIKQLMKTEKLEFFLWTMVPLLFTPLFAKKISMYILMIPYMVMNFLTNYGYQYDIGFQYTYGSCTLLIYMAIMYFEGAETLRKKRCILLMVTASLLCTTNALADKNSYYTEAEACLEDNMEILELFETIPKNASVSASTWFVPALSQRDEIHDYDSYKDTITDYFVFDMRYESSRTKYEKVIKELKEQGYIVFGEIEEKVLILKK